MKNARAYIRYWLLVILVAAITSILTGCNSKQSEPGQPYIEKAQKVEPLSIKVTPTIISYDPCYGIWVNEGSCMFDKKHQRRGYNVALWQGENIIRSKNCPEYDIDSYIDELIFLKGDTVSCYYNKMYKNIENFKCE